MDKEQKTGAEDFGNALIGVLRGNQAEYPVDSIETTTYDEVILEIKLLLKQLNK